MQNSLWGGKFNPLPAYGGCILTNLVEMMLEAAEENDD